MPLRPFPDRRSISFVAVIALASCSADGPTAPGSLDDPSVDPAVVEFVTLLNEHRTSVGCEPLAWNPDVAGVAQAHSADMLDRGFFDHRNPDGQSPRDRMDEAGIQWSRWGENIAAGYPSAAAVLNGWLNSPGHRQNIETCAFTEHGVGLEGTLWTHVFMSP